MDPSSDPNSATSSTHDAPHTECFTIDSLIQRVEEMQRQGELNAIERLTTENSLLQHLVEQYQRHWCATIDLLERMHQALLSLQKALEKWVEEEIAAERDWLAFWGAVPECTERPPGGWL